MGSGGGMRGGGGGGGAAGIGGGVSPEGVAGMGSLTTAEARAVYEYSGGLYTDIRRVVNRQAPLMESKAAVTRYMGQIDAAIGKGTLAKATTLYRRTGADDLGVTIGAIKPGQVLTSRYYQSTSASQSATERFRGDIRLTIQAGRGTKAVDVTHATGGSMAGEREVLMPRGTKYQVVSVSRKGTQAHVTVKVVK